MRWEWLLGESEGEITKKQRRQERENERGAEGVRDEGQEREGEGGQGDVKVPPITSCFSSTPSLCVYLFRPFFHSH